MKSNLFLITILGGLILISFSCQKNIDSVPPETVDSVKSSLPKQVIWSVGPDISVLSIKYDTANYRIELYEDDTTNSNPYDKLTISYAFNNDGYLVNYTINTTNSYLSHYFDHGTVNINRGADNKIIYIAFDDQDINRKDTSFYTYQSVSDGVNIVSTGAGGYHENNTTYHYDNSNNLIDYHGDVLNDYSAAFTYNPNNNSPNKILVESPFSNETNFSYSSGIPDAKEDLLFNLLIGKDNYLWDLKDLYPFLFYLDPDYDDYDFSATNPYHLTYMKDTHQPDASPTGIEEATLIYELNGNKLLSKVTFYADGETAGIAMFTY